MENIRKCPICLSNNYIIIKEIYGRCKQCGHIYQFADYGDTFYAEHKYRTQINYLDHSVKRARYIYDFLELTNKDKNKKLLDIGCGRGGVLYIFEDMFGIKGEGINPFPEESYIDERINVVSRFVTDLPDDKKYDIIIMSHSLEHIPNLYETIRKIKRILKDYGKVYIEVPHYFYTKQKLGYVFTPEHISYFYGDTLVKLLSLNGFRVIKYKESIKWSNIKVIIKKGFNYDSFVKHRENDNYNILYMKYWLKYYFGSVFNFMKGPND